MNVIMLKPLSGRMNDKSNQILAGVDGGIDFDVIRVLDEQKHQVSLKNKGKYEIGYS